MASQFWHSLWILLLPLCIPVIMAGPNNSSSKTIYLIRHAESEENRRIASLGRVFSRLGKFSLPSSSDMYASTQLLNVMAQVDSSVSMVGIKQIANMGKKLTDTDFVKMVGIQLVAHSPLLRAQETSEGMLRCRADVCKAETVDRVVQLDLLIEKTPQEWTPMYFSTFKQRIATFEEWLGEQPEEKISIVGHSQYFKAMLGLDFKFGNCDVWEVNFDFSKRGNIDNVADRNESKLPPQWRDLKQLYTCDVTSSNED